MKGIGKGTMQAFWRGGERQLIYELRSMVIGLLAKLNKHENRKPKRG